MVQKSTENQFPKTAVLDGEQINFFFTLNSKQYHFVTCESKKLYLNTFKNSSYINEILSCIK